MVGVGKSSSGSEVEVIVPEDVLLVRKSEVVEQGTIAVCVVSLTVLTVVLP